MFRPKVSQFKGFGLHYYGYKMSCIEKSVECELCFKPAASFYTSCIIRIGNRPIRSIVKINDWLMYGKTKLKI